MKYGILEKNIKISHQTQDATMHKYQRKQNFFKINGTLMNSPLGISISPVPSTSRNSFKDILYTRTQKNMIP